MITKRFSLPAVVLVLLALLSVSCDSRTYPYFATLTEENEAVDEVPPVVLDKDTSVVLYFDSSGSMDAMRPVLEEMIGEGGPLHTRLSELYGADYSNKVFIRQNNSEDTLAMLTLQDMPEGRPAKCAVFVFQDENDGADVRVNSSGFQRVMDTLHSRIDTEFLFYRGVVVQVTDPYTGSFKDVLQALENGTAPYEKTNQNLTQYTQSDPKKITILYDVPAKTNPPDPTFYSDLTVDTLRTMGVEVP